MGITDWTIYTEIVDGVQKPFVSFYKPGDTLETSFQIRKAEKLTGGHAWRFYPMKSDSFYQTIFIVTGRVRLRLWPSEEIDGGMVQCFLYDNKVLSNNNVM